MIISEKVSSLVRHKRVDNDLTKSEVAKELNIARRTLVKIESGNYDAPKRIYESVMNWLIKDLQKKRQKIPNVQNYNKGEIYGNY